MSGIPPPFTLGHMAEYQHLQINIDDQTICWLCIHVRNESANVLNQPLLRELDQACKYIRTTSARGLIVYSSRPDSFLTGSDIRKFHQPLNQQEAKVLIQFGQSICQTFADLTIPTVALIDGACFGTGLAFALAMDYRIAADTPTTHLGFPEIKLGLHPAFGATVRAVALLGARKAMDLMLSGKTLDAQQATDKHLLDACVSPHQLKSTAIQFILQPPLKKKAPPSEQLLGGTSVSRLWVARQLRKTLEEQSVLESNYPAPYALIRLWQQYGGSAEAMHREEGSSVAALLQSETSKNLSRLYLQQSRIRQSANKHLLQQSRIRQSANKHLPRPQHVHVIGAGTMGQDIAICCALQGMQVSLQDKNPVALETAMTSLFESLAQQHAHSPARLAEARARILPARKGDSIAKADIIIEAIPDKLADKQEVFAQLEEEARPDALLATTTSCIALDRIAAVLLKPERLIGLHFFNPALQLKLVEVGHTLGQTDSNAVETACAFLLYLGKLPLPVHSSQGYVVNRILMPYILQGIRLYQQQVPHTVLDKAGRDFGMPMGPLELADLFGLDYCRQVGETLAKSSSLIVPDLLVEMVNAGILGRKSGTGFYRYRNGRTLKPDRVSWSGNTGVLQEKLISQMVEEAALCVEQGVIQDPDLLDAAVVFGTGFAPFRGGPLQYARSSRK